MTAQVWVRVADAAQLLGVSRQAVYQAARDGRIKAKQQHGLLLVQPATWKGGTIERNKA